MIGRGEEKCTMEQLLDSKKSELLVVYGRRRVGKTFLVRSVYKNQIIFDFIGTQHAAMENQLEKFGHKLKEYGASKDFFSTPKSWAEAFQMLKKSLKAHKVRKRKKVVFFDEFPWIASRKSRFLQEFSYWWNDWAVNQELVVVICGSAASWMIKNIINHKGGLHNRVTKKINLLPFTLAESALYLESRDIHFDYYQVIQLYMSIGGVPQYLQEVNKGESAAQAINRICFHKDGMLRNEFDNLYAALFENSQNHIAVIRAISSKWLGMTRQEIIKKTKFSDGGGLTKILDELESSSFILSINPFAKKKKDTLYRLADEYSLFYLAFIEGSRSGNRNIWLQQSRDKKYEIWRGYAFENICLKHIEAIKSGLGISGVNTNTSSYALAGSQHNKGFQIDMLIDRDDQCINICEMKFYADNLTISADMSEKLRKRRVLFRELSGTKKHLFNTIVTTFGVHQNKHSLSQIDSVITMEKLFEINHF